ncbi:hypothetical protein DZF91_09650 [Actinomadura logoneensis]|uniref:Uncharacterized protein n=1 Tax=Actinomadura logoneensis TaxID=2293572 RepID=A0A372JPF2_9ACTN|nr:hypothetical protein [Actinomadura logoneensis]RFU41902.1 hypothetical protein DZF91_09650 [Actinomadura logoneensis]
MAEDEAGDEPDVLYVVVREVTADYCRPGKDRITPPLHLEEARRRAEEANAAAMPDVRYVVRPWSDWDH